MKFCIIVEPPLHGGLYRKQQIPRLPMQGPLYGAGAVISARTAGQAHGLLHTMPTWLDAVAIWIATRPDRTMLSYKGEPTMNRLIALFLIAGATLLATCCNTVAGAGQDISKGGHAIT